MGRAETISVALDIKRIVDAVANARPYQGITRYTLRLFQELDRMEEVVLRPAYLHPFDPKKIGLGQAIQECTALEEMEACLGHALTLPWSRRSTGANWLQAINRVERRMPPVPGVKGLFGRLRRRLIATSFSASKSPSLRCDIFHSTVNPLPPQHLTPATARVLTVHDCIYLKHPEFHPIRGRTPAIRKALDSVDVSRDYVICDSESTRRDLHEFLEISPDRTCVVPLSADEIFFSPDRAAAKEALAAWGVRPGRYVLALAQSEVRKNVPRLVSAFLRVGGAFPDHHMVMISGGGQADDLRDLLVEHDLMRPEIVIGSDVDDRLLSGLYSEAAVFAYVPLYEGFGIPPLEAMAAGSAVVVANNSSLPEVVGDAGLYVDALDDEDISQALWRMLGDPNLRAHLVAAGQERARSFSWRSTARQTVEVYRQLKEEAEGTRGRDGRVGKAVPVRF